MCSYSSVNCAQGLRLVIFQVVLRLKLGNQLQSAFIAAQQRYFMIYVNKPLPVPWYFGVAPSSGRSWSKRVLVSVATTMMYVKRSISGSNANHQKICNLLGGSYGKTDCNHTWDTPVPESQTRTRKVSPTLFRANTSDSALTLVT